MVPPSLLITAGPIFLRPVVSLLDMAIEPNAGTVRARTEQALRDEVRSTLAIVRSTKGATRETALAHLWFALDRLRAIVDAGTATSLAPRPGIAERISGTRGKLEAPRVRDLRHERLY